jgi:hypothetical protein
MVAGGPLYIRDEDNTVMTKICKYTTLLGLLVWVCSTALADDQGTKASIEKKLTSEYALTKTTDDKSDIVTAGAVLVLQKDKVFMVPTDATGNPCQNTYKDGKLSQSGACKVNDTFRKIPGFGHVIPGQDKAIVTRAYVTGEKFWLTKVDVHDTGKDKGVMLEFFTDAVKDVRYKGTLLIAFKGGTLPSPDDALKLVAEVITVAPSEDAKDDKGKGGQEAPAAAAPAAANNAAPAPAAPAPAAAAPAEAPPPPIEAPPPPPADPASIKEGQTPDEVVAALGQPTKKAKIGTKEIYYYKDLKVVFVNGKVKDVQ